MRSRYWMALRHRSSFLVIVNVQFRFTMHYFVMLNLLNHGKDSYGNLHIAVSSNERHATNTKSLFQILEVQLEYDLLLSLVLLF